jgi:Fe-S cluster biosynthesis and repair protein YggX
MVSYVSCIMLFNNLRGNIEMARIVKCTKLKKEAEGLDYPPYPGPLGLKIFENVSKEAWSGWLEHQTMLLNEKRLSLVDPQARKYLTEQTEAYFFGDGADKAEGYVPPKS